jgi:translation initiation factor IF-2
MAQVTVQQLAEVVGASSERLLTQMKEAGLPHSEVTEAVSDEDKQTLLAYLKRSHGESTEAPKRITLKRKKISTLRTSGAQGKKTVNVEVRKKRTYVKRDPAELEAEAVAVEDRTADEALDAAEAEAAVAAQVAAEAEAAAAAAEAESAAAVFEPEPETEEDLANLDPEILRQRAAARRKAKEAEEAAARAAAVTARKAEEERQKAEVKVREEKAKETVKRPKRLHEAPSAAPVEEQRRKQRGRLDRNAPAGRGKQRGHMSLSDLDAAESGVGRRRGGRKRMKATHEEHSKHGFEMPTERKVHEVEIADMRCR